MTDLSVRVCDDEVGKSEHWKSQIEKTFSETDLLVNVTSMSGLELAKSFSYLQNQWTQVSSGKKGVLDAEQEMPERPGILVIDFDLTSPDTLTSNATGGGLAGKVGSEYCDLVRWLGEEYFILLVNQRFATSTFDLTETAFTTTSTADLNVSAEDLGRTGLWSGRPEGISFRPWRWPRLCLEPSRRSGLVRGLDLDAPVLETLGLNDNDVYESFHRDQLVFLGDSDEVIRALTFRQAITTLASTLHTDRRAEKLVESVGDGRLKRVAVSFVCRWLDEVVLPGQNVLIDAPHLAQKQPTLLTGGVQEDRCELKVTLNALADLSQGDAVRQYFKEELEVARVNTRGDWYARPVWLEARRPRMMPKLEDDPLVFCEDFSVFVPYSEADEYECALPTPHRSRYLCRKDDAVDYVPKVRLYV